ncbi:DUF5133 domain-containing protein [Streptomyces sp. NPDC050988]|uniref:DUF5133 domain-containing protein n=1 Tax=Streptomyces sp. NPDC050988 TaxID=3365637 RepID=UPI00378DBD05
MPHPATLRRLVDEYEALIAAEGEGEGEGGAVAKPDRRAQDRAYTLCVSTGTRDVRCALERARRHLAAAGQAVAPMAQRPPGTGGAEVRDGGEAVTR